MVVTLQKIGLILWEVSVAKTKTTTAAAKKATTSKASAAIDEITLDRRSPAERREKADRPEKKEPMSEDQKREQERRKTPRRRQIDPTPCEREYSDAEIEFMQAMDDYKRANGRMFPTCSEILEVLLAIGYAKVDATDDSPADELDASESAVDAEVDEEFALELAPAEMEV